jgi:small subunit ribosomal protein S17
MIHDEENKSKLGDIVKIVECRPISKKKRWALLDVIKK